MSLGDLTDPEAVRAAMNEFQTRGRDAFLEPACKRCGGPVPRRSRTYCDECLPHYQREQYAEAFHGSGITAIEQEKAAGVDPTHGARAASRRAKTNIARKREAREWDEKHGKLVDLSAFRREILPLIQGVPLSRLQQATGLSVRYVSLVRRGERSRTRGIGRHSPRLSTADSPSAAHGLYAFTVVPRAPNFCAF